MWDGSVRPGYLLTISPSLDGKTLKDPQNSDGGFIKVLLEEPDMYIGCSIAVNGVCLTVREYDAKVRVDMWYYNLVWCVVGIV